MKNEPKPTSWDYGTNWKIDLNIHCGDYGVYCQSEGKWIAIDGIPTLEQACRLCDEYDAAKATEVVTVDATIRIEESCPV